MFSTQASLSLLDFPVTGSGHLPVTISDHPKSNKNKRTEQLNFIYHNQPLALGCTFLSDILSTLTFLVDNVALQERNVPKGGQPL